MCGTDVQDSIATIVFLFFCFFVLFFFCFFVCIGMWVCVYSRRACVL